MMKRVLKMAAVILLCFFSFQQKSFSQNLIGGIINNYWQVISVDVCNNRVALPILPVGINIGDKMLLMQMKGASIDTTDTGTYGTVTNYNNAGNYELLTVKDVTNNIITFENIFVSTYATTGKVQLIQVPQYTDVTIAGKLTALPWDGNIGGVVAFIATGTITMNADIDASTQGFVGGALSQDGTCYGGGAGYAGYRLPLTGSGGGNKGESIAGKQYQNLGRGAPANGGGGGNDSNTGGGGGSNAATGGLGGQRVNITSGCTGDFPGIGGYGLTYSNTSTKIFLGGGGGAGDDNSFGGTAGANGGGIIFIRANTITGNGFSIIAKGGDVITNAFKDGAGGGGGGGALLLDVANYNTVNLNVNGGIGGSVDNGTAADSCFGPGGGGGAGIILSVGNNLPATLLSNGNFNGTTIGTACNGTTNGATPGNSSNAITGVSIPEGTIPFIPLTLTVCNDTIVCEGDAAHLYASGTGTGGVTFSWSNGANTDTTSVTPTSNTTYNITISDSRGCSITKTVDVLVKSATVTVTATPDEYILGQATSQLIADTVGNQYFQWDPPTYLSDPNIYNPVANAEDTITYCVTAKGYNGCIDTACITVYVLIPEPDIHIPNAFTPNGDGVNDTWHLIVHECYVIKEMKVFNRWGMQVYDYFDEGTKEWSGTFRGQKQPMEVYYYYILAHCSERTDDETFKGNVTVIR